MTTGRPLRKASGGRAFNEEFGQLEAAVIATITRDSSGNTNFYDVLDTTTTIIEFGSGTAITNMNIGTAGQTVTISGDNAFYLDLSTESNAILINDNPTAADSAFVIERGLSGDDAVFLYEAAANRGELGFANTVGGSSIPASLSVFSDLVINNLIASSVASPLSSLSLVASGAGSDIIFTARSTNITLNDASDATLSGFTATSIIGALNELRNFPGTTPEINIYTNGEASPITIGQLLYVSGLNTVMLANATVNNDASGFIGVVYSSSIASAASGNVITKGSASVRFEQSLTLSPGDEVYISTTSGLASNIAPIISGSVSQVIGFVKNTSGYDGNTNVNAEVFLSKGLRA